MIISFINQNNYIQNDINIDINGGNTDISDSEILKLNMIFDKYKDCDITIQLKGYNDSYIQAINTILDKSKSISNIGIKKEENECFYCGLNPKNNNIKFIYTINNETDYKEFTEKVNCKCTINVDMNIYLNHQKELLSNKNVESIILIVKDMLKDDIRRIPRCHKVKYVEMQWANIIGMHKRNIFDVREYYKILKKMTGVANIILQKGKNDYEKFMMAYYIVGKNIYYAFNEDGDSSRENDAHSIKGAVLQQSAVCEGYAETLSQLLNLLKIKNECVTGQSIGKKSVTRHVWNQVMINNRWYNCDITNDSVNIQQGRMLDYCLISDEEMFLYKSTSKNANRCIANYNQNELESMEIQ